MTTVPSPAGRFMSSVDGPPSWSVVIPVKRLHRAKSRLAGLAGNRRWELALAVCLDAVRATLACRAVQRVVVVTDDHHAATALRELPRAERALMITDDVPDAGLNPALRHGATIASRQDPGLGVAALSADLPALRPEELARVLAAANRAPRSFLADAAAVGTTLYAVRDVDSGGFTPAFGGSSRARHRGQDVVELDLRGVDSVRRDVDTPADLRAAAALGLGPVTGALLADLAPHLMLGPDGTTRAR
ncbi:2-phospho-L-lactate guanylyltransferase [Lipingzhangella rawalii]|uniref:2-phospho-L-lactate guanylyltransferase n=1 Tax=Lipingzhangella rawalii TaxID=2055835 RepID=UPI00287BC7BE|nr:2-phospho-L-lactate guanylyltransferase [Lipingzhangella rawalii]